MSKEPARARWLVFAVGNPSRGDDALGPLLVERLERWSATAREAAGRSRSPDGFSVAGGARARFARRRRRHLRRRERQRRNVLRNHAAHARIRCELQHAHALSPACVLAVAAQLGQELPQAPGSYPCRAQDFELGAPLSATGQSALGRRLRLSLREPRSGTARGRPRRVCLAPELTFLRRAPHR